MQFTPNNTPRTANGKTPVCVLGINRHNGLGWAAGSVQMKRPRWGMERLAPLPGRESEMFDTVHDLIAAHAITHCVIEAPAHLSGQRATVLSEIYGGATVIELACRQRSVACLRVETRDWRKRFLGFAKTPPGLTREQARLEFWRGEAVKACGKRGWLVDDFRIGVALALMDFGLCQADSSYTQRTNPLFRRNQAAGDELIRIGV